MAESENQTNPSMKLEEIKNNSAIKDDTHNPFTHMDNTEIFIWVQEKEKSLLKAKQSLTKAQKYYRDGDYFDCLLKLEKAMESFEPEIFCIELKEQSPLIYSHMRDCMI